MKHNMLAALLATAAFAGIISCGGTEKKTEAPAKGGFTLIRSDYAEGEITTLCDKYLAEIEVTLKAIEAVPEKERTIDNTLLAYENAVARFFTDSDPLIFMASVSPNEKIIPEATKCEEKRGQYLVDVSSRKPLYNSFAKVKARSPAEGRLLFKTKEEFERSGIALADAELAKLTEIKRELTTKETQFSNNLNQDKTTVTFAPAELDGVTADFLARLKKDPQGNLIATTKSTDYIAIMENAKSSETRKKMQLAYLSRGGMANVQLLQDAMALRQKAALALGYKTWADYRTSNRTAKSRATVDRFLKDLRGKMSKRYAADTAQLLKYKKELDPKATQVDPWDISYLTNQLKKRDFSLDNEKIREYFPSDKVTEGIFGVYSELLGLKFEVVPDANVWSPDVKLYAIRNAADGALIGYFYADLFPRPGKYGHAAAFSLVTGRQGANGYVPPVSAIVANFTPPGNGKPGLFSHDDDVETFFHEFGHIMHQTLTKAPYASLAGTSVPWDFVEAPSQMLENWVWNKDILKRISGHYLRPEEKLPDDLITQMVKARDFQQGTAYMRQLLYATYDFSLHVGDPKADAVKNFFRLYKELLAMDALEGSLFPAGFGHMMGGYDAGYYGYLWSKVYAQDMFSLFESKGLLDKGLGMKYRQNILEKGNMRDASDSLRAFLGREPNSKAFFKLLGVK